MDIPGAREAAFTSLSLSPSLDLCVYVCVCGRNVSNIIDEELRTVRNRKIREEEEEARGIHETFRLS